MATDSEVLCQFSAKIYVPPLSQMRDDGTIRDLSNPVAVLMLVIDFETEVSMNGIANFIGNSTGVYANETVEAIRSIGCSSQAEKLARILSIAANAGMSHDAIQRDRQVQEPFAVTSFAEIHGEKWSTISEEIRTIELGMDYDSMWQQAESFVGQHRIAIEAALS